MLIHFRFRGDKNKKKRKKRKRASAKTGEWHLTNRSSLTRLGLSWLTHFKHFFAFPTSYVDTRPRSAPMIDLPISRFRLNRFYPCFSNRGYLLRIIMIIIPLYQPEEGQDIIPDPSYRSRWRNLNLERRAREARVESNRIESKVSARKERGRGKGDETGQRSGVQDRSMCKNDSQRIHYPERN